MSKRRTWRWAFSFAIALALLTAAPAEAQQSPAPAAAVTAEDPAESGPVAIPVAAIAAQASNLEELLRAVEASFEAPADQTRIAEELAAVEKNIRTRARRLEKKLNQSYDRADLDALQAAWRGIESDLADWESSLDSRLSNLDKRKLELSEQAEIWEVTAAFAQEEAAPAAVRTEVQAVQKKLRSSQRELRRSRDAALALQRSVVGMQKLVAAELAEIAVAREEVLRHLLRKNSEALWELEAGDLEANRESFGLALREARASLQAYASKNSSRVILHVLLLVALVVGCVRARRAVIATQETLGRPLPPGLEHPTAAGLVLGLTAAVWLHPSAPPKLGQLLTLIALPFWFPVLRGLVPSAVRKPLIGLLVVVPLEVVRQLLMDFETLGRVLLVIESLLILGGMLWLRHPSRLGAVPRTGSLLWLRLVGAWLHFGLFAGTISLLGSLAGWTTIADLLLTTVAIGSFIGSILFAAVRVLEGMTESSVLTGQLQGVRFIHSAPHAFLRTVERVARTVALGTWGLRLLDYLAIQRVVLDAGASVLAEPLGYGSIQITLGGLLAFGISLWLSWLLSRFVAFFLEREVLTRVGPLPRGVPFALSTISRYVILVLGFVMAIASLGVEVGNLALVISALGVGIGFGMQNVVNNFISGLILLFERPIKVGDRVSIDPILGEVTRIGIRASVIRTFDGADVIVPNGDLISNQVTNWTLADTRRRVILPVGVVYGTPAQDVIDLLLDVAHANPDVMSDPEPVGLFTGFGDSSLDFELRIWTESDDALTLVRSRLAVAVQRALDEAGIEVPFPQRDLHVKTVPDFVRTAGASNPGVTKPTSRAQDED